MKWGRWENVSSFLPIFPRMQQHWQTPEMDILSKIVIYCNSQIMDDRWETEVIEYGAINITGFRIVDTTRRYVRDFLEGWKKLDPATSQGAGKESISVNYFFRLFFSCSSLIPNLISRTPLPPSPSPPTTSRRINFWPHPIPQGLSIKHFSYFICPTIRNLIS